MQSVFKSDDFWKTELFGQLPDQWGTVESSSARAKVADELVDDHGA